MIAFATATDGPALVAECYGDDVGWLDWQRPGFDLALALRDLRRARPRLLGRRPRRSRRHLAGPTRARLARPARSASSRGPRRSSPSADGPSPSGRSSPASRPCRKRRAGPKPPRWPRSCGAWPPASGLSSATSTTTPWCSTSCPGRGPARSPPWARRAPTTSCAPRSGPCSSTSGPACRAMQRVARLHELHGEYRRDYAAYYDALRRPGLAGHAGRRPGRRAPARRGHVQLRRGRGQRSGRRRVLRQRHQRGPRGRVGVHVTGRSPIARSSGSSTGSSKSASSAPVPRHCPCRARSRWSPAVHRGSGWPSATGWRPKGPASPSSTSTATPPTRAPPTSPGPVSGWWPT